MTILSKIASLKTIFSDIRTAIINKGVTPTGGISTYATAINNIEQVISGGGSSGSGGMTLYEYTYEIYTDMGLSGDALCTTEFFDSLCVERTYSDGYTKYHLYLPVDNLVNETTFNSFKCYTTINGDVICSANIPFYNSQGQVLFTAKLGTTPDSFPISISYEMFGIGFSYWNMDTNMMESSSINFSVSRSSN